MTERYLVRLQELDTLSEDELKFAAKQLRGSLADPDACDDLERQELDGVVKAFGPTSSDKAAYSALAWLQGEITEVKGARGWLVFDRQTGLAIGVTTVAPEMQMYVAIPGDNVSPEPVPRASYRFEGWVARGNSDAQALSRSREMRWLVREIFMQMDAGDAELWERVSPNAPEYVSQAAADAGFGYNGFNRYFADGEYETPPAAEAVTPSYLYTAQAVGLS